MKKILYFLCLFTSMILQGCLDKWTDEKSSFSENIIDLQGGDFRLHQSKGLMFQSYRQPLNRVDIYNDKGEVIGRDFEEEWMKESSDRLNHEQIRLIAGRFNQKASIIFNEFAQDGSWWVNDDLSKIFITTDFYDFHKQGVLPASKELDNARIHKMFKSIDGGQTFKQLNWSKRKPIVQVLFDQTGQYGYVIGGNRELWRSSDAGETWKKIEIPKQWRLRVKIEDDILNNIVTTFDAYYLDEKTKTLYLSCFKYNMQQSMNEVYALPWRENLTDMNQLKPIAIIPDVYITAIQTESEKGLYFLTEKFDFSNFSIQSNEKSTQFIYFSNNKTQHIVELGDRLKLGVLYQSNDGVLIIVGSKVSENFLRFADVYLVSKDQGKTWSFHSNASSAEGQTFDMRTGRLWRLEAGRLYSKKVN